MTQKQARPNAKTATALPVVLFGLDQRGKPTAARFAETQAALAAKAATQLRLRVLAVANPAIAELAAKLPAGRIHASGKGLVSHIRTDLYGRLVAAAGIASLTKCRRRPQTVASPMAAGVSRKALLKIAYPRIGMRLGLVIWCSPSRALRTASITPLWLLSRTRTY